MNKQDFIKVLAEKTGLSEEQCTKANEILENTFIVGKKNKEEVVNKLQEALGLDAEKAEKLYEDAMGVIGSGLKDKLKHPFGAQE